jgi:adenosylhomocysteine nucleosidase
MTKEHEQLTALLNDARHEVDGQFAFDCGRLGENSLVLMQCGIGKVNAAVGTMALIQRYNPDCIVSTGCAGGIADGMAVMDVVVSTATCYHDVVIPGCDPGQVQGLPARFRAEEQLVEAAMSVHAEGTALHAGLIASGDQFISSAYQLAQIKATFPEALAVDMESAAIGQVAFLMHKQFISLRIISDVVGKEGQLESYEKFKQDTPKTAAEMVDTTIQAIATDEVLF